MNAMGRWNNRVGVATCVAMYGLIDAATIDPQFARNVTVYHVCVQTKYTDSCVRCN